MFVRVHVRSVSIAWRYPRYRHEVEDTRHSYVKSNLRVSKRDTFVENRFRRSAHIEPLTRHGSRVGYDIMFIHARMYVSRSALGMGRLPRRLSSVQRHHGINKRDGHTRDAQKDAAAQCIPREVSCACVRARAHACPSTHRESTYAHFALLLHQSTALHHVELSVLGVSPK